MAAKRSGSRSGTKRQTARRPKGGKAAKPRDRSLSLGIALLLLSAGMVVANNLGLLPETWREALVVDGNTDGRAAPMAEPRPAPVRVAEAPAPTRTEEPRSDARPVGERSTDGLGAEVGRRASELREKTAELGQRASEKSSVLGQLFAERGPRPRRPEPEPEVTPEPAAEAPEPQPVADKPRAPEPRPEKAAPPPAEPAELGAGAAPGLRVLTPDQRRERLLTIVPPDGFTAEWRGGSASLNVAHNEIMRGRTELPRVALTFDSHYGGEPVDRLLATLAKHGVRSTFFLTGKFADLYPETVRRIAAAGHEIANHSLTHPNFTKLTDAKVLEEVEVTEEKLLPHAGEAYKPYFRPPYGDRDTRVLRLLIRNGYVPIYWTVDTLDWKEGCTAQQVLDRIRARGLKPGAIVLSHAGSEATVKALPQLLTMLEEHGLEPTTVSGVLKR